MVGEEAERVLDDQVSFVRWRRKGTREVVNYDPRMEAEALEGSGLVLERFLLV